MAYPDYNQSLPRNSANHSALSPLSFLARSAQVYPDRLSVVHGAALGIFAYGTYDLTAMAVIRDWPIGISLLDMAWGATISAVSATAGRIAWDRFA